MDRNMGSALNVFPLSSFCTFLLEVQQSTLDVSITKRPLSPITTDFPISLSISRPHKKKEAIKLGNTSQANLKSQDHGTLMSR